MYLELSETERKIILEVISQVKFLPNEWETLVKPIVKKLQAPVHKVETPKVEVAPTPVVETEEATN